MTRSLAQPRFHSQHIRSLEKVRSVFQELKITWNQPLTTYERGEQDRKRVLSLKLDCLGRAIQDLEEWSLLLLHAPEEGSIRLVDYCRKFGLNPQTAYNAAKRGDIPGAFKDSSGWRVPNETNWVPKGKGRPLVAK